MSQARPQQALQGAAEPSGTGRRVGRRTLLIFASLVGPAITTTPAERQPSRPHAASIKPQALERVSRQRPSQAPVPIGPHPWPGGITAQSEQELPVVKPVLHQVLRDAENAAIKGGHAAAGAEIWRSITKFETYALRYSVLTTQLPDPFASHPSEAGIRSNPLLETLVAAAKYCDRHKIDAHELFGTMNERSTGKHGMVAGIVEFLATDLNWGRLKTMRQNGSADFEDGWSQQHSRRVAASQAILESAVPRSTRLSFAHALAVAAPSDAFPAGSLGPFNPWMPAARVLATNGDFPELDVLTAVLLADGHLHGDRARDSVVGTSGRGATQPLYPHAPAHDNPATLLVRAVDDANGEPRQPQATRDYAGGAWKQFEHWADSQHQTPTSRVVPLSAYLAATGEGSYLIGNASVVRQLGTLYVGTTATRPTASAGHSR